MDQEIEQFPAEKRRICYEEPPELIFFDVDGETEEADFIRVDDLFTMDKQNQTPLSGHLTFTLFPQISGKLIDSRSSRLIHRSLVLTALRLQHPLEKVRVRPRFVQWQIELNEKDKADELAREFRDDMEDQILSIQLSDKIERFWSNNFFVCPIEKEIPDETIIKIAADYQRMMDNQ